MQSFSPPEGISVLQVAVMVAMSQEQAKEFQSPGGDFGSASQDATFAGDNGETCFSPPEGISVLQEWGTLQQSGMAKGVSVPRRGFRFCKVALGRPSEAAVTFVSVPRRGFRFCKHGQSSDSCPCAGSRFSPPEGISVLQAGLPDCAACL